MREGEHQQNKSSEPPRVLQAVRQFIEYLVVKWKSKNIGAYKMAYIESRSGQSWLLPLSLENLIPEDHICYLIESLVDSLDYSVFDIWYRGAGHPAYHPSILVKLLIMGVLDRVRSSRGLARNARENGVYMYLSEKLTPDFRTIRDFRKDNSLGGGSVQTYSRFCEAGGHA